MYWSVSGSSTLAVWVRLDTVTTWSRIFDFGTGATANMFLTPRSSAGTVRFGITTSGAGGEQHIDGPSALPAGAWTHIAVTKSGGTGILYVNGAEAARSTGLTIGPAALGSTTQNWLGRSQYADPYLAGALDDLRIHSRALTATEVSGLAGS